jgi:endo-1,4-beta-xylanase
MNGRLDSSWRKSIDRRPSSVVRCPSFAGKNGRRTIAAVLFALVALCGAPTARAAGEPLRVPAERRSFYVGAAVNMSAFRAEPVYRKVVGREFNVCVAENVFKFSLIHPRADGYDFAAADELAAFARSSGMKLRGHTLVWHNQVPAWLTNGKYTREQAIEILREHIATVVTRYKDSVWAWDVVNEAVADNGASLRTESYWHKTIGPEYLAMAFRFAREADPDAILYYNDYNNEDEGPKADAVYALVADLKKQGVPIDGVGWQMHVVNGFQVTADHRSNARRLAALGLELSVTELDVRIPLPANAAALARQADAYRDIAAFCLSEPAFKALVLWGFTDKHSWIPGFFPGTGEALIFDADYRPKPAYESLRSALSAGTAPTPVVSGLAIKGKNLTVSGGGFDQATEILLDGASQKTQFKSPTRVVGKKAGLGIRAGDTVRVLTSDGSQSNDFAYYPFP